MISRVVLVLTAAALVVAAPALAKTTFVGSGNDTLRGTSGSDRLGGGAGDDRIAGFGSGDTLFGGTGRDRIFGGPGPDRITGESGHDELWGGPDGDLVRGRSGDDAIRGDAGDDFLDAGAGRDRVSGDADDDTILGGFDDDGGPAATQVGNYFLRGGPGDDRILGGPGNDSLAGDDGVDRLDGDEGNDALVGGPGFDALEGDAGDDLIDAQDGARDQIDCGVGLGDRVVQDPFELSTIRCQAIELPAIDAIAPGTPAILDSIAVRVESLSYDPKNALGRPAPGFFKGTPTLSSALVVFDIHNRGSTTATIDLDRFSLIGPSEHVIHTSKRDCSTGVAGVLDPDRSRILRLSPSSLPSRYGVCVRVLRRDAGKQVFLFDRDDVASDTPPGVAFALPPG